jgi:hypothetical protein
MDEFETYVMPSEARMNEIFASQDRALKRTRYRKLSTEELGALGLAGLRISLPESYLQGPEWPIPPDLRYVPPGTD